MDSPLDRAGGPSPRRSGYGRAGGIALGGLLAMAAAVGIGRFVYTPILPFMAESLALSETRAGVIASANFLGYLLGALAAARTTLPGNRHGWLVGALAVSALTTGAMALGSSMPVFLALRFAGGVASAFVLVFASALVLDRLAAMERPALAAVHFAGVGFGIAASAVLVAVLVPGGHGWRTLWLASGAVSLLALGAVARLVPKGGDPPRAEASPRRAGTNPRLRALIAAYGLFGFGYVITATFISTIVRSSPEIRPLEPLVWLLVGLAAIPSVALWTWVGRRWGNARAFAIACLAEGAGVAASVIPASAPAVILGAVLLGGTFMGITALGLINARALSSGDPRRGLALMTASFGLGQMIGPAFAGFAYRLGGNFLLPSLVAAAALAIAAALVADRRSQTLADGKGGGNGAAR